MPMLVPTSTKPRVILGCMTFGPNPEAGARITSLDDYKGCLDYMQGQGYNEIDTARVYIGGEQEAFTRAAGWEERGLTLATKIYPQKGGEHAPSALRTALETSLKELGTKCVDIWYLHAADRTVPFEESLAEVDKLHKEGKFVHFGISNFTAFEVAEVVMLCRQHGWVRPSIYQGVYNAIYRSLDKEVIPACKRYGIDVVVYNPLAGGLFSGKYSAKSIQETPDEGRFSNKYQVQGKNYRDRYFHDATFEALSIIEPVVKEHGLTMLETALRWCVHHSALEVGGNGRPGHDGIIIGVSSLAQLKGNLTDLEKGPLPDEVVKALDAAARVARMDVPNYWHKPLEYTYDTKKALFG